MEKNTIQSDVIRGNINTIILKALYGGERYGYDIIKEINEATSGQYDLKQPTLYSCLTRLESQGFIESYWGSKSNGGRRKYYSLTDLGREVFLKSQSEWEFSRSVIDRLISDKTVDLDALAKKQNGEVTDSAQDIENSEIVDIDDKIFKQEEQTYNNNEILNIENQNLAIEFNQEPIIVAKEVIEPVYVDTSDMMNQLFRQELNNVASASYTEKLISQKYVADRTSKQKAGDDYFKDFYNASGEVPYLVDENKADNIDDKSQITRVKSFEQNPLNNNLQSERDALQLEHDNLQNNAPKQQLQSKREQIEQAKHIAEKEKFINYNENIVKSETAATSIFGREYRNILGSFANSCFVNLAKPVPQPVKDIEKENIIARDIAENKEALQNYVNETVEDTLSNNENLYESEAEISDTDSIIHYTKDGEVNKKFNKMANDVRELGDNIKIRTAGTDTSKEYSKMFHFYSNKLMLRHYAMLFGIMLIEIIIASIIVYIGLKVKRPGDMFYFVGAVIFALIFPIVAFVKNYSQPNKTKRINFNLKSSVFYRTIVMAQCLLIIYCFNLFINMPLTFDIEYATTLILPALLCTNFPVSALIYNSLFKSKRYAID